MLGYHVNFGAYGHWLPNDPRGSLSDFVGSRELFGFGPATKTTETRSVARRPHDRALRLAAKTALKYPPVKLSGIQARAVGRGFARYVERSGLVVWACAILPDHVHLVLGRHRLPVEQIVIRLKGDATCSLIEEGTHPFGHIKKKNGRPPKCFAEGGWKVYLNMPEDVVRSIRYVENNPVKEGKPLQAWGFVSHYQGIQ